MKFEIGICKRGRKCNVCGRFIRKEEKYFQQTYWPEGQDYPTKKNVCQICAKSLCDSDFIKYLKELVYSLVSAKNRHKLEDIKPDEPVF